MRILTLVLMLLLTACAPDGSSSAGTQEASASKATEASEPAQTAEAPAPVLGESVEPQETVQGEPVEPRTGPMDSAATAPESTVPAESAAPSETVPGESVEPQPQPVDSAPDGATKTAEDFLTEDGVDYSCKTNADCEVKNVGNCCGYYPACVNKDSPTFPEKVKAACAAEGSSSICGFPEISSCDCIEGRCAAVTGPGGGEVR